MFAGGTPKTLHSLDQQELGKHISVFRGIDDFRYEGTNSVFATQYMRPARLAKLFSENWKKCHEKLSRLQSWVVVSWAQNWHVHWVERVSNGD